MYAVADEGGDAADSDDITVEVEREELRIFHYYEISVHIRAHHDGRSVHSEANSELGDVIQDT